MQGIWTNEPTNTPRERPAKFGGREFLTDEEVAEKYKEALAQDQRRMAEIPNGPCEARGTPRPSRARCTRGSDGNEYNNYWVESPKKPNPNRVWRRTSLIVDPPDGIEPPVKMEALNRQYARLAARKGAVRPTPGRTATWLSGA